MSLIESGFQQGQNAEPLILHSEIVDVGTPILGPCRIDAVTQSMRNRHQLATYSSQVC